MKKLKTMKKLFLLAAIALTLSCCNKDDDTTESLPPATQTGAGTFACNVNGRAFIDTSGGYFNCFYQLVDGDYYFGIQGQDDDEMRTVVLSTTAKSISENEILLLLENIDGHAWGGGRFNTDSIVGDASYTNSQYTGELSISKLDFVNNIVSGTFWFDIEHPVTGETVEIRNGRFDTLFTQ